MKNTKLIKVSTADRLPEKRDYFHTNKGQLVFLPFAGWYRGCMKVYAEPEYWLDERPDYEEEMKDMLERIVKTFETDYVVDGEIVDSPYEWLQDVYKDAKQLIKEATELK